MTSGLRAQADGLLGHWRLLSWTGRTDEGKGVRHGGERPQGDLLYLPSGRMSVQICHSGRARFGSRDLAAGDEGLQASAYRTYIAYAGTYSLPEPGVVVHHVEIALHPDQVGMDKRRSYELDGATLTLRTQPVAAAGSMASSILRWGIRERLDAGSPFPGSP